MSVAMTEQAVRDRTKTVTRRKGWLAAKPGDRLTLVRKSQGRKPGEPLVRLAEVEVVSVRRERLWEITDEEVALEGFPGMRPVEFVHRFFVEAQGMTEQRRGHPDPVALPRGGLGMTVYTAPVRRREYGRGHGYVDANGVKVPGVTTILGDGLPKKALINWAANSTAEYAVDHWDELGQLSPSARLKKLQGARYEDRDTAANRGTAVHNLAEKLVQGEEVEVPDELAGHVESYVQFLDDWEIEPVLVEAVVMSHKHGYAGTLDLLADCPTRGTRALMDIKTSRSGIFGETALQTAAYRYADVYVDADGAEQPMLDVDEVLAIHVRADGYDLRPLVAGPQQLRQFLYARQIAEFADESRGLVGEALVPPRATQRRRLQIVENPGQLEIPA